MGQAISMAAIYCCCSAGSSLCNSCFGTVAVGTTGRKRSVLLLALVIATALWFQYNVGPSIVSQTGWIWKMYKFIPGTSRLVYGAWYDSCDAQYPNASEGVIEDCAGNAGVYRPTFLSTLYFVVNAVATRFVPTLNREAWPAKYALFGFGLLVTVFVPNDPLFVGLYLWLARIGAAVFVVLQQVILIDVAYNWNDDWVERANESDRLSFGSGSGWLHAIVGVCVSLYVACITCIGLMYKHYTGGNNSDYEDDPDYEHESCAGNTWVITLTLLGILAITALQLLGTSEGSLLTSGVISLYAVYLCFTIVSKNPRGHCNPRLGENDVWGITIGLLLTTVSLIWTGWSWSAEPRLMNAESLQSARAVLPTPSGSENAEAALDLDVPLMDGEEAATSGMVTTTMSSTARESAALSQVWKLNVVLALISCYVAMILTGWGTIDAIDQDTHNAANPTVGRVNMAILGISQWLALMLYAWTLVAPILFPDREFS
jgi:hypothetical protein